jgi:ribosomal-protein-alanine N-acetyltransferase
MKLQEKFQIIETSRLRLRELQVADSEAMLETYSDPETMKYWSAKPVVDLNGAREMVQADVDWAAKGDALVWAITNPPSDKVLGKCVLFQFSHENQRAEFGYVINRSHWAKGYMTETLTAIINFAFNELGLHRLEVDTDAENLASLRVMEKLGFTREGLFRDRWRVYGEWQDSAMLALLKPEWISKKSNSQES